MLILPDGRCGPSVNAIRLVDAGSKSPGESWSTLDLPPYRAQHHSLQHIVAGSGAIEVDAAWQEFRCGHLVLVPGQRWLRRRGDPGLSVHYLGFTVEPLSVDRRIAGCRGALVLPAVEHPAMVLGLEAAGAVEGMLPAVRIQVALHLAIAMFVAASRTEDPPVMEGSVLRARDFIEAHYLTSPSLAMIAHAAGRSPHHLHQCFTRSLACTPAAYAQRLRLRDAQALLLGSDLPVQEVALRCGYPDPFHFARVLRRECGLSPSEMRRRSR